jgi:hypothetical protein
MLICGWSWSLQNQICTSCSIRIICYMNTIADNRIIISTRIKRIHQLHVVRIVTDYYNCPCRIIHIISSANCIRDHIRIKGLIMIMAGKAEEKRLINMCWFAHDLPTWFVANCISIPSSDNANGQCITPALFLQTNIILWLIFLWSSN